MRLFVPAVFLGGLLFASTTSAQTSEEDLAKQQALSEDYHRTRLR